VGTPEQDTPRGRRVPSLRERNRQRTRQELLDSALAVFTESGYGSATVDSIAARAGTSKVTLYSYFPQGRDELFRELYEQINDEMLQRAAEIYADEPDEGDATARVLALTDALMDVACRPLLGRFYSIEDPGLERALDPVRGHASRVWADYIAADLEDRMKLGEKRGSAATIAQLLVGAMRSALREVADGRATRADVRRAMSTLLSGL
jgi:AcrR family transcriptional regulator